MTRYVVGFLFDPERRNVLLIQKNRPAWQKGCWNGIGGHIEEGETPLEAMYREGLEEAGLNRAFHLPFHPIQWQKFARLDTPNAELHIYRAFSKAINSPENRTDEQLGNCSVQNLPEHMVTNARWLIPMALSMDADTCDSFAIQEVYGEAAGPSHGDEGEAR